MLNLRSIAPSTSGSASARSSVADRFSRFTAPNFVVPEIGNIGEPLDHFQVESFAMCNPHEELAVELGKSGGLDAEEAVAAAGPSGIRSNDG
ncbi:uncharacterized protein PHACADRAFT_261657 [Phanerochaete carnosa HHB-10118-sp]|uniref:Uncharacterized protein n=1 Tax=Phanerochaete carnosa (strain HHB-10118-sp) TaxID=650164 RepID=K5VY21_PHACS|nr:uncharacterized protein PHACADRAFT_261657 [Phanerochaete carnosa HHB-10118-sp]EKM51494.1 hypothetical protein PHACADRAFT_261657 [Phanerochaete carnosa HHB-10118-sp]